MNIVCIALTSSNCNRSMVERSRLPLQLVAIIADLIDAGHKVNWIEQPLCKSSMEESVDRVACINPDVLLFACDGRSSLPLMAGVAVRCDRFTDGEYICDGLLRPARNWCNTLSNPEIDLPLLVEKIKYCCEERAGYTAMNDSSIEGVATPV